MKAVHIHDHGGLDFLHYEDAPRPTPGAGEVLIHVHSTTINPFDCAVRAGYMGQYFRSFSRRLKKRRWHMGYASA